MDFSKLGARERMLLGICSIVVICAASDWIVVQPVRRRFRYVKRQSDAAEAQTIRNLEILARAPAVLKKYESYAGYVRGGADDAKTASAMLTEIETYASEAGLNMVDRKPQGVVPKEYFSEHTVRVEVEGETWRIIDFLHAIESSRELLRVKRIDLAPSIRDRNLKTGVVLVTRVVEI